MTKRLKTIEELLRNEPPACACVVCQDMCLIPCWGTPDEMRRLIDAGYGDRLSLDLWSHSPEVWFLLPALKGEEGKRVPRMQYGDWQGCTFWTADHRCALHESGLKPLEGRMTHHHPMFSVSAWIHQWIAAKWNTPDGRALVEDWKAQYFQGATP